MKFHYAFVIAALLSANWSYANVQCSYSVGIAADDKPAEILAKGRLMVLADEGQTLTLFANDSSQALAVMVGYDKVTGNFNVALTEGKDTWTTDGQASPIGPNGGAMISVSHATQLDPKSSRHVDTSCEVMK